MNGDEFELTELVVDALETLNLGAQQFLEQYGDTPGLLILPIQARVTRTVETVRVVGRKKFLGSFKRGENTSSMEIEIECRQETPGQAADRRDEWARQAPPEGAEDALTPLELDIIKGAVRDALGTQLREPLEERWRSNLRELWQRWDAEGDPPEEPTTEVLALVRQHGYPRSP